MAYPYRPCLNSKVNIISEMIGCFTSMINFLHVLKIREILIYPFNNLIISLKRLVLIFFLYKIKSNNTIPIHLARCFENVVVLLICKHFKSHSDVTNSKVRVSLINLLNNGLKTVNKHSLRMLQYEVSLLIVLIQSFYSVSDL